MKKEMVKKEEEKKVVEEEKATAKKVENKRLIVLGCFVGLLVLVIIIASIISNIQSMNIIEQVRDAYQADKTTAVYIMKDDCQYCILNKSNIDSVKSTYGASFLEVDLSKLTGKDKSDLASILNIDSLSTPTLAIVGDKQVKDTLEGVTGYNELFNFLKKHSIISSDAELILNYINYDQYKGLIKSKEPQVIVLAASTCHYCLSTHPILEQVSKQYNIKINYLYMDKEFGSENESDKYNEFKNSLSWLNENEWGTPTTLIVQDGKVVSSLSGYNELDTFVKFFTDAGLIK